MRRRFRGLTVGAKAQSVSEYSLCVAIVLIAAIAINVYVKRGLQGRYRDVTDAAIQAVRVNAGRTVNSQYEPYYADVRTNIDIPRNLSTIIDRNRVTRNLAATSTTVNTVSSEGGTPD
ncbi:MAG: hypothetical protein HY350_02750 [Candidatus Omnitrophica bacterium]|nr:hypothetical protein [Candidatus Omnitrophota bacterium]